MSITNTAAAVEHNHVDLRLTPDEPVRTTYWKRDLPVLPGDDAERNCRCRAGSLWPQQPQRGGSHEQHRHRDPRAGGPRGAVLGDDHDRLAEGRRRQLDPRVHWRVQRGLGSAVPDLGGSEWRVSDQQVLRQGPSCPSWCTQHLGDDGDPLFAVVGTAHRHHVVVDDIGVMIEETTEAPEGCCDPVGPVVHPDDAEWVSENTIRNLAAALLTAHDLIAGREPQDWARLTEWFQVTMQNKAAGR